jgi:1-acyl-sn-glycerol-3-phosphate acyltransferase
MGLSKWLLRMAGWKVEYTVPDYPKCIICVAPHTSNWDFILGELTIRSIGRKAGFLMKESWFRWPLGAFFRSLGGVPVPRKNKTQSLTEVIVKKFHESSQLVLAITPEGTRKPTAKWHSGFLYIVRDAGVPLVLGAIDYKEKRIVVDRCYVPTGDIEQDMQNIKQYYKQFHGLYPEKFITD